MHQRWCVAALRPTRKHLQLANNTRRVSPLHLRTSTAKHRTSAARAKGMSFFARWSRKARAPTSHSETVRRTRRATLNQGITLGSLWLTSWSPNEIQAATHRVEVPRKGCLISARLNDERASIDNKSFECGIDSVSTQSGSFAVPVRVDGQIGPANHIWPELIQFPLLASRTHYFC